MQKGRDFRHNGRNLYAIPYAVWISLAPLPHPDNSRSFVRRQPDGWRRVVRRHAEITSQVRSWRTHSCVQRRVSTRRLGVLEMQAPACVPTRHRGVHAPPPAGLRSRPVQRNLNKREPTRSTVSMGFGRLPPWRALLRGAAADALKRPPTAVPERFCGDRRHRWLPRPVRPVAHKGRHEHRRCRPWRFVPIIGLQPSRLVRRVE